MGKDTDISKFLSFVLRHDPGSIGLSLDSAGWADVRELLTLMERAGRGVNEATLRRVVAESDKKRFTFSDDGRRIRAAQGHSVSVELGLEAREPPDVLFHGAAEGSVAAILAEGLKPMARRHVHLSVSLDAARKVGERHGRPVVFVVDALRMWRDGLAFFQADNGVWLTDHVPRSYLTRAEARAI
ncbi:putative RNA 2'-phosphotransferase [Rhodoblastus acidophilus]|uniref:RNA 2'-phosphotransferase n=1 Tax=Rhodoblastus acidophilus TaxID=1074 RepID=UPI00222467A5|nr:RNA 2'-phosphotransferase [Rhodoblastus acidophilus]MCW2316362.1 putative RNA 2'-phosphotransferase [Rhodoblastus acidophilus]